MTTPVITIDADARVIDAAEQLSAKQITSMPVLDADGRLVGMISELDILRGRLVHDPRSHLRRDQRDMPDPDKTVRSVMTPVAVCLTEFADVADIAETMLDGDMRAIPIVDGPRILGIVSRRDLLRTLLRSDETIAAEIRGATRGTAGRARGLRRLGDRWDCHDRRAIPNDLGTRSGRRTGPNCVRRSAGPPQARALSGREIRNQPSPRSLIHTFERG
jgi:CBS domain-containing protein